MEQFKVTAFHLQTDDLIATVNAGIINASIIINRADFEHWLTDGTGQVAYCLPGLNWDNDLTGRQGKMPITAFWDETPVVILADIYTYLTRSQGSRKEVMAEIGLQQSLLEIGSLIPLTVHEKAFIHIKMLQYGFDRSIATIEKMTALKR